jgi:hypothetical protein
MAHSTWRCEWVNCCKPNCHSCPHGPYWYEYYREGKRLKKRYRGKKVPWSSGETKEEEPGDEIGAFLLRPTFAGALLVLGLAEGVTVTQVQRHYRVLALQYHPDRGGSVRTMQAINAAYGYVIKHLGR